MSKPSIKIVPLFEKSQSPAPASFNSGIRVTPLSVTPVVHSTSKENRLSPITIKPRKPTPVVLKAAPAHVAPSVEISEEHEDHELEH